MDNRTPDTNRNDEERRVAERKNIEAAGELRPCAQFVRTHSIPVQVRDVSGSGIGIVHSEPLPPGAQYVVKQESFSPDQPRLYTVVRSKCKKDGSFVVGLQANRDGASPPPPQPTRRPVSDSLEAEKNFGALGMIIATLLVLAAAALVLVKASS